MVRHLYHICVCLPFDSDLPFYYMEQWNTFYWDGDAICQTLSQSGGVTLLLADFLMQFFAMGRDLLFLDS